MVSLEWTYAYLEKVFRLNLGAASSLLSHRREPVKLTAYPPGFLVGCPPEVPDAMRQSQVYNIFVGSHLRMQPA